MDLCFMIFFKEKVTQFRNILKWKNINRTNQTKLTVSIDYKIINKIYLLNFLDKDKFWKRHKNYIKKNKEYKYTC